MCTDWRPLNSLTIKNRAGGSLPRCEDLCDRLSGASVFSSLDLQSGYNQIRIFEADVPKTAFNTPLGHFQYKVLAFGLTNAPATFQAVMNRIFAPHLGKFVVVYLDDILVYSRSAAEHEQHLKTVLATLRQHRFYAKMSKCAFNKPEVAYLGHIVGRYGLRMDPKKVAVVRDWPTPRTAAELRSFLGLCNYFRRFIQGYSSVAACLHELLRKGVAFAWGGCPPACF